jgi:hypothetical protein
MSTETEDTTKVKLRANGDLTITEEGQATIVAHYDKKTGVLEFASQAFSEKYYHQVTARIGSVAKGTEVSGLSITRIGIMGLKAAVDKDAPEQPNPEDYPLGDADEAVVQWMLDYDLPQAIARYGIFCDAKGKPIKKKVRRIVVTTVDNRNLDDSDLEPFKQGKSQVKGPVMNEGELIERDSAIIARRATALTFTPSEVVGGFRPHSGYRAPVAATVESEE